MDRKLGRLIFPCFMLLSGQCLAAEPSPDELGAFASPQAFAEACSDVRNAPAPTGTDDAANAERVILGMGNAYCEDMIKTVSVVASYYDGKVPDTYDGPPACIQKSTASTGDVLNAFLQVEASRREEIKSSHRTTVDVLLPIVLKLSPCPTMPPGG